MSNAKAREKIKYRLYQENNRCGICKKTITIKELYSREVNLDHIEPRYHGGSDDISNLQITHTLCNKQKGHDRDVNLQNH